MNGDWFFFWNQNPFGPGSSEPGWVFWLILGSVVAFPIVLFICLFCRLIIRNKVLDRRLKNPEYAEKNKGSFFRIDSDSVILRSGMYPYQNKEWVLSDESIIMKPHKKKDETLEVALFQVTRIEIHEGRNNWLADSRRLCVWCDDGIPSLEPAEDELPDYSLVFKPIGLEAAEEIVRRFNEYIANRKNK
jgi:hypothetical protein